MGGVTDVTEVLLAVVQSGRFVADLDDTGKFLDDTGKFLKSFCALCAQANFESDLEKYVAGPISERLMRTAAISDPTEGEGRARGV